MNGTATPSVLLARITVDHRRMGGMPCIRDLRIPVATIIGQLAAGADVRQVLEDFPDLEPEDVSAALAYAAGAVQERELPLLHPDPSSHQR